MGLLDTQKGRGMDIQADMQMLSVEFYLDSEFILSFCIFALIGSGNVTLGQIKLSDVYICFYVILSEPSSVSLCYSISFATHYAICSVKLDLRGFDYI